MTNVPAFPLAARVQEIAFYCRKSIDAKKMTVTFSVVVFGHDSTGLPTKGTIDIEKHASFELASAVGKREVRNQIKSLWEQVKEDMATEVSSIAHLVEDPDWKLYESQIATCVIDMSTVSEQAENAEEQA
jgi:hypothetical protein